MSKFLVIILLLLHGCELFTNYRTITVSLPEKLPPWFLNNTPKGTVWYPGVSGSIESIEIEWKGSFTLEIEKGNNVPIACYPSGYLKPAGAILTADLAPGQNLLLNWSEGFLAEILVDLKRIEIPTEHLNIDRLAYEIQIKSEGDPWLLNRELLIDSIIYNSLSVYKIKSGIRKDISIPIEGSWVSDNPFYPLSISNFQGELILEGIYPGMHRFKNLETKQLLDILVWDDGYEYLTSQQY